jgi:HK97 family phage major capsid protein
MFNPILQEVSMTIGTQDLDLIKREVASIREYYQSRMDADIPPIKEEVDRLTAQLTRAQDLWREGEKRAILSKYSGGDRPRVPFGKYTGLDLLDLACVRSLLNAQLRDPAGLNPRMLEEWQTNIKAAMDSTTGGVGDELVDTQEARALWDDVNPETAVAPLFNTIQMPSNPFQIPLQLGEVNWYPGTENVATKSTALTTTRQTLTAYELVAEVPWSYDLDEDAIIAMMAELRRSLLRNAREVIDDVLLNSDSTATNNINADGATISTTDAGKGQWLLGFDGVLHLPLVDNTSQANNHNAAVSDDMFNEIRAKLGKYGVRPSEVVYICVINTYIRSLSVDSFRTLDKFGPQATVLTGQLGAVEGIPVIVSEQMKLADTDGKVTDGGNATDTGRLLIVNRSQWRVGFKRELSIETVRDPQKRQNIMVVSFRIALQERSGTRSTATHSALQYNITGV